MSKKWLTLTVVLVAFAFILAACQTADPEIVEVTRVVTETITEVVEVEGEPQVVEVEVTRIVIEEVEAEPGEEVAEAGAPAAAYRVGIFEDPVSLNRWNSFGPGNSVWTSYVLSGQEATLFNLSDQRFDFVPELAVDLPEEPVQEGDLWTITVPMVENAVWSDGQPITAHDVAFTQNVCLDLKLTQGWVDQCQGTFQSAPAEALDDYTVKFTFNTRPGLGVWQAGVALAPILPEHFWGDAVAESRAFIEGLEEPAAPEDVEDCTAEELSDADAATCEPYLAEKEAFDEAFTNARVTLYEADPTGVPTAGGYSTDTWEPGAFVQRTSNDATYLAGAQIIQYDDGTWILNTADGRNVQLYGDATGEETLNFVKGPYQDNVIFTLYGDQSAAYLAMANGEVDYVLNPLSIARGLREQAQSSSDVTTYVNDDYGMFYLAFNMRFPPFNDLAFRQAVEAVIDKEFVAENVLQGSVFPMYSAMPPGNGAWFQEVPTPYIGMSRSDRLNAAIGFLEDAGYTWDQKPEWDQEDDTAENLINGEGLRGPDGALIEPFEILGPGPAYDPQRASFNQWITEWMREIGIPVESQLTGFNTILNPVFVDGDFDMYILGWSLGNVAFPDYFCGFWHSRNDTVETGGNNSTGYASDEYDALCEAFESTSNLDDAKQSAFDMQLLLAQDLPYVNLFYRQAIDLIRTNVELPYTNVLGGIADQDAFQVDSRVSLTK